MVLNLVIVESPNKIKAVKSYLEALYPSQKWEVAASVGHFAELTKNIGEDYLTQGVLSNFEPEYQVSPDKRAVVSKLKKLAESAEAVYLASDADREGEAIADMLRLYLKLQAPKRVLFNEITKNGISEGMQNVGQIDLNLVNAQKARRVLDRLVGFLVSPALYELSGIRGASAGRVQTPVLRLIYERCEAIKNFKSNDFFDVILNLESNGVLFKAKLDSKKFEKEGYFTDKALAEKLAAVKDLELTSYDESEKNRIPPSALTTSLMQQLASSVFKIKPKNAMKAAQNLFESGLITYHRTDNPNISPETFDVIKNEFSSLGVIDSIREFKSKEGAQEGHPAITPTDLTKESAGLTGDEKNIYTLIRKYAIASQLKPAKYKVRKAVFYSKEYDANYTATGSEIIDAGFLTFLKGVDDTGESKKEVEIIPDLNANDYKVIDGNVLSKKTNPPKLYTIKTLLSALEKLGIGRPATLDGIFETLEIKQYILIDEKNNLSSTELGEKILSRLIGKFNFVLYEFTADMEKELDLIAEGKSSSFNVLKKFYTVLSEELEVIKKEKPDYIVHKCPECGSKLNHIYKRGAYDFWGCSNRDNCKYSADNVDGKPVKKEKVKPVLSEFKCPDCSQPLVRRTGKSKKGAYDFWGCSGFSSGCKATFKVAEDGKPVF